MNGCYRSSFFPSVIGGSLLTFLSSLSCYSFGQDVYYVPSDAIGVSDRGGGKGIREMSECIGSFSSSLEGLLGECHGRAKNIHIEDGEFPVYNRIWLKRDVSYGAVVPGWLRIPYHLINIRDGSHSTYYWFILGYTMTNCDQGCYALVVEPDSHPPQHCQGNPVEVTAGEKYQKEVDIVGPIEFSRYYRYSMRGNPLGPSWRHTFDRQLRVESRSANLISSPQSLLSSPFGSMEEACVAGWADMKGRMKDAWFENTVANYDNGACYIRLDDQSLKFRASMVDLRQALELEGEAQKPESQVVAISRPDGSSFMFVRRSSGWESMRGTVGQLTQIEEDRWKFVGRRGEVEIYSADGVLEFMKDAQGNEYHLNYDVRRFLTSVESNGRRLSFEYDWNVLSEVRIDERQRVQFSRSEAGMLEEVRYADGSTRSYHYEDDNFPTRLAGIVGENGQREATWQYDDNGRVVLSVGYDGANRYAFEYGDTKTTVINPLKKSTTFHYEVFPGGRRVTSVEGHASAHCSASNKSYDFSSAGYLESKTDWAGAITNYVRDDFGRETSRTEAAGTPEARTITTEYHPYLSKPVKITEPGRVTSYTYDAEGRLTSQQIRSTTMQKTD